MLRDPYFREIAKRTESSFVEEFMAQVDEVYIKELLSQIWRNSEILTEKFNHISAAFNWMVLALLPWIASLAFLALRYPSRRA
jgi:hypothetical protein